MSKDALNNLRDFLLITLQPNDLYWLGETLIEHSKSSSAQVEPYTMDEINAMMDEAEQQFANGAFHDDEEVFDRLYKKYGLKDEVAA